MKSRSILLVLFFLLISFIEAIGQDWELKKDDDGIRVYTKTSHSSYKIFRAEMIVDGPIDGFVLLLKDESNLPNWLDKVEDYSIPSADDDYNWTAWSGIDMPWPVDDRDVVTVQVLKKTDQGYIIEMKSEPDLLPIKKDYVRLKVSEGYWAFENKGNNKIKVTYEFLTVPEGIPSWVVNMFIVDSPYKTLKNMREMAKTEPYKSVDLKYLR